MGSLVSMVSGDRTGDSGKENGFTKGFPGDLDNADIIEHGFVMGEPRERFLSRWVALPSEGRVTGLRDRVKARLTGDLGVGEGDFLLQSFRIFKSCCDSAWGPLLKFEKGKGANSALGVTGLLNIVLESLNFLFSGGSVSILDDLLLDTLFPEH